MNGVKKVNTESNSMLLQGVDKVVKCIGHNSFYLSSPKQQLLVLITIAVNSSLLVIKYFERK